MSIISPEDWKKRFPVELNHCVTSKWFHSLLDLLDLPESITFKLLTKDYLKSTRKLVSSSYLINNTFGPFVISNEAKQYELRVFFRVYK